MLLPCTASRAEMRHRSCGERSAKPPGAKHRRTDLAPV
jgi:hypothetical protein